MSSLGGMGSKHQNERINFLRQLLDSSPSAPDGFLSYEYGLCPPCPLKRLPSSDTTTNTLHVWEQWADHLPNLYQTGKYLDYFLSQPILTVEHLADEHLLRANQILGLCAHATVHFSPEIPVRVGETPGASTKDAMEKQKAAWCPFGASSNKVIINNISKLPAPKKEQPKSASSIPPAIMKPWKEVNARLGRPKPTFTYYDYFTLNVVPRREGPLQRHTNFDIDRPASETYEKLRCDVQVFGDSSENIFVLINHDMEYQSKDLVRLCCDAIDFVIAGNDNSLRETLSAIGDVVKKVTDAFVHAVPNNRSRYYCDPVSWSKSIGMLIPPILDGEYSMSGLQSSVVHLLDVFLGRYDYSGVLGDLAMTERSWLPSLHQQFFRCLQTSPSVRKYVCNSKSRALHTCFDRVVRLFGSEDGFLGAHRIKTLGFLELGIKTGRTETSGQTAKADGAIGWQSRPWRKVNEDFYLGMEQRMKLQCDPLNEGFTQVFVQSVEEQVAGSGSFKITMNVANSGLQFRAGDRLEVLPANTPSIVQRMLTALLVDPSNLKKSSLRVKVSTTKWKEALARHYHQELANEDGFPLPAILNIMHLRPLTRSIFDAVCDAVGMKGVAEVEVAFQNGKLNDVPDVIKLLHALGENSQIGNMDSLYNLPLKLCSVLPPNEARLYSIANSPPVGVQPSIVTIVVSQLWFEAVEVKIGPAPIDVLKSNHTLDGADEKVTHLGVCTSFLLKQSLFQYVSVRVIEEDSFHLPSIPHTKSPLVFVALGSGSAPIMAFLEELLNRGLDSCPSEIYFFWGLREVKNLIGLPLLTRAVKELGLKLCISFSGESKMVHVRESGDISVIDGMKERITTSMLKGHWPKLFTRLITKTNAHFFLCGHPALEISFRAVLESSLCTELFMTPEESTKEFEELMVENRLHADCFYSGSVHDPNLRQIPFSEVARHVTLDDIWWIFQGCVYDVSKYMNLHPGGSKILFDKAGRDCTADFEVTHGRNNLRVESSMIPFRIGNIGVPSFPKYADRQAYKLAIKFLHSVCEIRNVFYLDVNIFAGLKEANGSPHSLAMRLKTAEKFVYSSIPLLLSATEIFCDKLEEQIPCSSIIYFNRTIPSLLSSLKGTLRHSIGGLSSSDAGRNMMVVTEICQIGCDFLTGFLRLLVDFVSSIEQAPGREVGEDAFTSLNSICKRTIASIENQLLTARSPFDAVINLDIQESLSKVGGCWRNTAPHLNMNGLKQLVFQQGECIYRKDDIIDSVFVLLSGSLKVEINGICMNTMHTGSAFGALVNPLNVDISRHMLGKETMSSTIRVGSTTCVVSLVSAQQISDARRLFLMDIVPRGQSALSPHWKKAITCAKVLSRTLFIRTNIIKNSTRRSGIYKFLNPGAAATFARNSMLVHFANNEILCKIGDRVKCAWILLHGRIEAKIDGEVCCTYSENGMMFGDQAFLTPVDEGRRRQATLVASSESACLCIPGAIMDSIYHLPLQHNAKKIKWLGEQLSKLPFFSTLPAANRVFVEQTFRQINVWPGQRLFEKGEAGDACYIVVSGELVISSDNGTQKMLKRGGCVGVEQLLADNSVRSTTCTGKTSAICFVITRSILLRGINLKALTKATTAFELECNRATVTDFIPAMEEMDDNDVNNDDQATNVLK